MTTMKSIGITKALLCRLAKPDDPRGRNKLKVADWMTKQVAIIGRNDTVSAAGTLMWNCDCGALPVVDESGRVVAMITDRDICMAAVLRDRTPSTIVVAEVMSKTLHFVSLEDSVTSAEDIMRLTQVRRLPVLDSECHLLGILSFADIVRAMSLRVGVARDVGEDVIDTLVDICSPRDVHAKSADAQRPG